MKNTPKKATEIAQSDQIRIKKMYIQIGCSRMRGIFPIILKFNQMLS